MKLNHRYMNHTTASELKNCNVADLIKEANLGTTYDDGFNQGDGSGSVYFVNLTDHDTAFHSVRGMRDKPLGLKRLAASTAPAHWNAMHLNLLSNGSSVPSIDNLIPNGSSLRWNQVILQNNQLLLAWRGGLGPYQLQQNPDLGLGSWENLGATTLFTTSTVEVIYPR
jgi:hypothetical protein